MAFSLPSSWSRSVRSSAVAAPLASSFARRRTIPVGRAAGTRGLPLRSHPQRVPLLAVRQVEPDGGAGVPGPWNADAQFRDAVAVRNLPLLRRRVRVLSEALQRYANEESKSLVLLLLLRWLREVSVANYLDFLGVWGRRRRNIYISN